MGEWGGSPCQFLPAFLPICIKEAISDTLTAGSTTVTAPSALQEIAPDLQSRREVELVGGWRQRNESKENPRLITSSTMEEEANPLLLE